MSTPRSRSPTTPRHSFSNVVAPGYTGGGGRRGKSGLRSRGTQLLALRFGWVVLVVWYEVGEFFHSLSTCKFPDSQLRPPVSASWTRGQPPATPPTHLVLLADPHVPHPRLSYSPDSNSWVNWFRQNMDELFMRKSWNVVMRLGRVDAVVVLGDMLDAGRNVMTDDEYEDYYKLFTSIFNIPPPIPIYYVPGNHDIPLGPKYSPLARDRYAKHFSQPNAILEVANHSLILLDAVGLVEEDYRRYASEMQFGEWDGVEGGVIEFIKDLHDDPPPGPKILISHIPLARPEASTCGPHREYGRILKGAGPGYQNLLGSETSQFLLDALKPSIVFSGDDHDYCDFTHPGGIREVTLKSFSSSTGIRRPGLQLLSLVPPNSAAPYTDQRTIADRPCFLPDQAGVYSKVYLPFTILTLLYLFGTNIRSAWQRWNSSGHSAYGDLKSRLSPNLPTSEKLPGTLSARRATDRPVPLTLPTRKSSQHLSGLMSMTPTGSTSAYRTTSNSRLGAAFDIRSSRSAPVSPTGSPRMSFAESFEEAEYDAESALETPNLSRRSSYIYMNGIDREKSNPELYQTPGPTSQSISAEPSSYFLPVPGDSEKRGSGSASTIGNSTPSSSVNGDAGFNNYRRSSLNSPAQYPYPPTSAGGLPNPPTSARRVSTMPRLLSTSDWAAAAKAKDKSVLGLMVDSISSTGTSSPRAGWTMDRIAGFVRWLWNARNGVVGKSWREAWAVTWPVAIVWVVINALFFLS